MDKPFLGLTAPKRDGSNLFFSAHSLAEVYSVLTRIPAQPPITPDLVWQLMQENILSCAQIESLTASEYLTLIDELVRAGVTGGAVYDAVIARVAELTRVDHLVTFNERHFRNVWPAGAARVAHPQALSIP